jgi:hypothetical protein
MRSPRRRVRKTPSKRRTTSKWGGSKRRRKQTRKMGRRRLRGGTKLLKELGEETWDRDVRAATQGTRLDPDLISIKTRVKECTTNELGTGVVCSDSQIKVINREVDVKRNSSGDKTINKLCPYLDNKNLMHDPHCMPAYREDHGAGDEASSVFSVPEDLVPSKLSEKERARLERTLRDPRVPPVGPEAFELDPLKKGGDDY